MTRSRWKTGAATAAFVAAVLVTTACAAPVQTSGGGNAADGTTSMLIAADNGSPTFERNFNPYSSSKRNTASYIYEPLVIVNEMSGEETPWLAESYEQPDASTVVFHLRDGVTWSDGEDFTADDVVYTFDLLMQNPQLDLKGIGEHIESTEADGDDVIVHLSSEDVPAAVIIAQTMIVPEHLWKDVDDPVTFTNEDPIGTGPYTLGDFTPNQYTLVKNESYWQADKVAADELIQPAANSELDIVNNGYDWAYAFMSDVEDTWVAANPDDNTYWFPAGATIALIPNMTKEPYNNLDFRQGISLALDKQQIADKAEQGYVDQASQSGLMLPAQEKILNADLPNQGIVEQDTDAALAAFAKAGYTQSGGKLVDAGGQQLSINITTPNGWSDWLQGVQQVKTQLNAIGINVEVVQPQPAAYQQQMRSGDFDMVMGTVGGTGQPYQDFGAMMGEQFYAEIGTTASGNFGRFQSAEADALLAELKTTVDEDRQVEIAQELQQITYDQMPMISLFYGGSWGLFSTKSFTGWPSADDPYASPKTWDQTPLLILTSLSVAS
ncbi:ABC transporter substrate-binding protein [Cellulomonas sp. RIT-PI-Y]|uniref:ABC transporter substrate-binding protein n=1 Tax=Cellulomonas sp. RIT-PI-Y TaxID=3035297 RepID=UPI0021DB01C0|nr:ABC transporter substrate-binding protein [Cellulomonas sp. RIT-PI-Y]